MVMVKQKAFDWGAKSKDGWFAVDWTAVFAETVATSFLVIMACGAAVSNGAFDGATRLMVAFSFGMSILALAYATSHLSGGQVNPAVTFALWLAGTMSG